MQYQPKIKRCTQPKHTYTNNKTIENRSTKTYTHRHHPHDTRRQIREERYILSRDHIYLYISYHDSVRDSAKIDLRRGHLNGQYISSYLACCVYFQMRKTTSRLHFNVEECMRYYIWCLFLCDHDVCVCGLASRMYATAAHALFSRRRCSREMTR